MVDEALTLKIFLDKDLIVAGAKTIQAKMVRTPLYPVEPVDVERAIRWLDEQWGGAVYVPDELRDVAAVA